MSDAAGRAYVEIEPDLSSFAAKLGAGLAKAAAAGMANVPTMFKPLEAAATAAAGAMTRSFTSAGKAVQSAFAAFDTGTFADLQTVAAQAAAAVAADMKQAAAQTGQAFATVDASSFADLQTYAAQAAAAVASDMKDAAFQAAQALGTIDASSFADLQTYAAQAAAAVAGDMKDAAAQTGQAFATVDASSFADLQTYAAQAAAAVASDMKDAAFQAAQALGTIDASSFADLQTYAADAAAQVTRDMGGAATRVKEAWANLQPRFSTLVTSAAEAGTGVVSAMQRAAGSAKQHLGGIGEAFKSTSIVQAAAGAGSAIAGSFQKAAQAVKSHLGSVGESNPFRGLENQAASSAGVIEAQMDRAIGGIKVKLAGLASVAAAVGQVKIGVSGAAALEQTKISFTALYGSATEAEKRLKELQRFAATTPFELPGLQQAAIKLKSVGVEADAVIPMLTAIGDTAAVLGAPASAVEHVTFVMQQMTGAGRMMTQDLYQLQNALPGFSVFDALAKGLGKTQGEVRDMVSEGLIPAEEGIQMILQGMREFPGAAGAMANQATTLNGLMSTFKDTMNIALTEGMLPLIPALKRGLADVTPVVDTAIKAMGTNVATGVAAMIQPLIGLGAALAPTIGPITDAFARIATSAGPGLAALGQALAPIVSTLASLAGSVFSTIVAGLGAAAQAIAPFVAGLASVAQAIATAVEPQITRLVGIVTEFGRSIGESLGMGGEEFASFATKIAGHAADIATGLVSLVGRGLVGLRDAFVRLRPTITEVAETLGRGLTRAFDLVSQAVRSFVAAFRAADGDITSSGFNGFMERLGYWASQVIPRALEAAQQAVRSFVAAFRAGDGDITSSGFNGFMERLGYVASIVVDKAKALFDTMGGGAGVFDTIGKVVGQVADALGSSLSRSLDNMLAVFEALAPILPLVAETLQGVFLAAVEALAPILPKIAEVIGAITEALVALLPAAVQVITSFIEPLLPILPGLVKALGEVALALGDAFVTTVLALLDAVRPLLPIVAGLAGTLGGAFAAALTALAPTLVVVANAVAVIAEVLAPLAPAILYLVLAYKAWIIVQTVISHLLFMNPIGLVVAAVAALVAGIIYAYQHSETFRNILQSVWDVIRPVGEFLAGVFVTAWNALSTAIAWAVENLGFLVNPIAAAQTAFDAFKTALGAVADFFSTIPDKGAALIDWFTELPGKLVDGLGDLAGQLGDWIAAGIQGMLDAAERAARAVFDWFRALPGKIIQFFTGGGGGESTLSSQGGSIISGFLSGLVSKLGDVAQFFLTLPVKIIGWLAGLGAALLRAAVEGLGQFLAGLGQAVVGISTWFLELPVKIVTWLVSLGGKLLTVATEAITQFVTGLVGSIGKISAWFLELPGKIVGWLVSLGGKLLSVATEAIGSFVTGLANSIGNISSWFFELPGKIVGWLGSLGGKLLDVAKAAIGSFVDGLKNAIGGISSWFLDLPGKILGWLKGLPGKLLQMGMDAIGGFITGLADKIPGVKQVVGLFKAEVEGKIIPPPADFFNKGSAAGKAITDGVAAGISGGLQHVRDLSSQLAAAVKNPVYGNLRISSPSEVMRQAGLWVAEGLADGMDAGTYQVSAAAGGLATAVVSPISRQLGSDVSRGIGERFAIGAAAGITGTTGAVDAATRQMMGTIDSTAQRTTSVSGENLRYGWQNAMARVADVLRSAASGIESILRGLAGTTGGIAANIIGTVNSAASTAQAAVRDAQSAVSAVSSAAAQAAAQAAQAQADAIRAQQIVQRPIVGMYDPTALTSINAPSSSKTGYVAPTSGVIVAGTPVVRPGLPGSTVTGVVPVATVGTVGSSSTSYVPVPTADKGTKVTGTTSGYQVPTVGGFTLSGGLVQINNATFQQPVDVDTIAAAVVTSYSLLRG